MRHSPLIGPKIPVHGLLVDIETGKVEWLVNGYQTLDTMGARLNEVAASAGHTLDALKSLTDFEIGGIKFPETKIGETVDQGGRLAFRQGARNWRPTRRRHDAAHRRSPPAPPRIPLPPPMRPRLRFHKGPK